VPLLQPLPLLLPVTQREKHSDTAISTVTRPSSTVTYPIGTVTHPISTVTHPIGTVTYPISAVTLFTITVTHPIETGKTMSTPSQ